MQPSSGSVPSKEAILADLRVAFEQEFGLSADAIEPATHLVEDLDLDSLDAVDVAARMEESTGLALRDEDLKSVETVQDIVDLIHAALVARGAGSG